MERMSGQMQQVLTAVGWYAGRQIDADHIKKWLIDRGFPVHPEAMNFFREFGDLHLRWSRNLKGQLVRYGLDLSGVHPQLPLLPHIALLQSQVGPLTPIAQETNSLVTFMMSPSGDVFAFIDEGGYEDLLGGPWPTAIKAIDDNIHGVDYPTSDGKA